MSRWLSVLNVAAGVIMLKSMYVLLFAWRPFTPTAAECELADAQSLLTAWIVVFYMTSAFICAVAWPVVYDAMGRTAYRGRWNELNVARWMLLLAVLLEGFLAWYWGSMPCYVATMPHIGAARMTALAELLVASVIFYATFVAQKDARKAIG